MIDLSNRTALVTGGSRGIGAATAIMLAQAGADVAILYSKDKNSAEKVVQRIRNAGREAALFQCRLEHISHCRNVVLKVFNKFKRIDILVNSGGLWEFGEIGKMKPEEWKRTIDVNLTGTFNMCNIVVPYMKKQEYGRIINISSTAGQRGEAFHSHYAASKGGIIAFTKSIAPELISKGIWVNCVAPGWVETDMAAHIFKNQLKKKEIIRTIPRGKIGTPEEIAGPIVFLASNLADN